jgi:hypothetical protein
MQGSSERGYLLLTALGQKRVAASRRRRGEASSAPINIGKIMSL